MALWQQPPQRFGTAQAGDIGVDPHTSGQALPEAVTPLDDQLCSIQGCGTRLDESVLGRRVASVGAETVSASAACCRRPASRRRKETASSVNHQSRMSQYPIAEASAACGQRAEQREATRFTMQSRLQNVERHCLSTAFLQRIPTLMPTGRMLLAFNGEGCIFCVEC